MKKEKNPQQGFEPVPHRSTSLVAFELGQLANQTFWTAGGCSSCNIVDFGNLIDHIDSVTESI